MFPHQIYTTGHFLPSLSQPITRIEFVRSLGRVPSSEDGEPFLLTTSLDYDRCQYKSGNGSGLKYDGGPSLSRFSVSAEIPFSPNAFTIALFFVE